MKTHPFITLLLLAPVLFALGCESSLDGAIASVDVDSEVPSTEGDVHYLPAVDPAAIQAMLEAMTPDARKAFRDSSWLAGSAVVSKTRRALKEAGTWQEADKRVRRLLTKHQGRTAYLAEQFAALEMLGGLPPGEPITPDGQEAIAFYTQLLLEHESPAASVLLRALCALKGYWPEDLRRQAATATARRAEAWLSITVEAGKAVDASLDGQPQRGGLQEVQRRRLVAMRNAVDALQELAQ